MVGPSLVCHGTATGTYSAADEGALAPSHKPSNDRPAGCRADNDLRTGMVLMIIGFLNRCGAPVATLRRSLLGAARDGKKKCRCEGEQDSGAANDHEILHFQLS